MRDIVGLYLHPPDHAIVLCIDEKSQIQALDRTHPLLALGLGYVEGVTHDYVRQGTTTLFAALMVASGRVLTHGARAGGEFPAISRGFGRAPRRARTGETWTTPATAPQPSIFSTADCGGSDSIL